MKSLKVGLCGVGNVGGSGLNNIISSSSLLEAQSGVHFEIIKVGARKGNKVVPYKDLSVTKNLLEVAKNKDGVVSENSK